MNYTETSLAIVEYEINRLASEKKNIENRLKELIDIRENICNEIKEMNTPCNGCCGND